MAILRNPEVESSSFIFEQVNPTDAEPAALSQNLLAPHIGQTSSARLVDHAHFGESLFEAKPKGSAFRIFSLEKSNDDPNFYIVGYCWCLCRYLMFWGEVFSGRFDASEIRPYLLWRRTLHYSSPENTLALNIPRMLALNFFTSGGKSSS